MSKGNYNLWRLMIDKAYQNRGYGKEAEVGLGHLQELTVLPISIEVRNESVDGIRIKELRPLLNRKFVISRIKHREGGETELVNSETILHVGDIILVISTPIDVEAITIFFGKEIKMEWEQLNKELISRRILITKPELNGKTLSQLKIRTPVSKNRGSIANETVDDDRISRGRRIDQSL